MFNLSKKELQIIHELETNARQNLSTIAKKCKLSKETVNYHIKKLESLGVIKEYFTLINRNTLGLSTYRIYIKQKKLDAKIGKEILDFLRADPNIWVLGKTSGEFDFAVGISTSNDYEFGNFTEELMNKFSSEIQTLQTQLLLEYNENTREYLTNEPKKTISVLESAKKVDYDKKDLLILDALKRTARISSSKIAKKIGLSERQVRYRIKRMEREKIIVAYRCNIDYRKLGYNYYKIDLWLEDRKNIRKIRKFVNTLPQTVYSERTVYYSDVEFDIEVKGTQELLDTVQHIAKVFPNTLKEFKYYTMLEFYK